MSAEVIVINRAPVLALWGVVVARRAGFAEGEALSLAKTMTGLNAQAKGRALGIFKPGGAGDGAKGKPARGEEFFVRLCSRPVPAVGTDDGVRAVTGDKVIEPEAVRKYLSGKFGDDLVAVRAAMEELAAAFEPGELEERAFALYERFRPQSPAGTRGWGAKGELDLAFIRGLAQEG